jgi:hypothetical protein
MGNTNPLDVLRSNIARLIAEGQEPIVEKRWCWWINTTQDPRKTGGYVPSRVDEDEPGHAPMSGDPEQHQAPWIWGQTLVEAEAVAERENAALGITPERARDIVTSSMFPTKRHETS